MPLLVRRNWTVILAAAIFSCATGLCWGAELAADRVARARRAEDAFRSTHFFAEGRGLHTAPNAYETFQLVRSLPTEVQRETTRRMGFLYEQTGPIGLFWTPSRDATVGAVGCVACHAGRAAGRTYIGLGNKTIDVGMTGRLLADFSATIRKPSQSEWESFLHDDSERLSKRLADERVTNVTRGLVSTALIHRWFYEQAGRPLPVDFPRGQTKVPQLWGFGEKKRVGQFVDGFGDGRQAGWIGMIELAAGQSADVYRNYRDKLTATSDLFDDFLPPTYPFAIDRSRAERGLAIFTDHCSRCHGEYRRDEHDLPIFQPPRFVSVDEVGTDDDRLNYRRFELPRWVDESPLNDLIVRNDLPPGYFAPRLEGVWSRFPYLHNGSVPTLAALLTPEADRPRYWSLEDAGEANRFDETAVGLALPSPGGAADRDLARRAAAGSRDVYFIERVGHANRGHAFGTDLSAAEKAALVEYLKTL